MCRWASARRWCRSRQHWRDASTPLSDRYSTRTSLGDLSLPSAALNFERAGQICHFGLPKSGGAREREAGRWEGAASTPKEGAAAGECRCCFRPLARSGRHRRSHHPAGRPRLAGRRCMAAWTCPSHEAGFWRQWLGVLGAGDPGQRRLHGPRQLGHRPARRRPVQVRAACGSSAWPA